MRKFIAFLILIIPILICSCQTNNAIEVKYSATEGGYIEGITTQKIDKNSATSSVTAIANEGYVFIGWSDGYTEPTRSDTLTENSSFTASFSKSTIVSVTYMANEGGYIQGNTYQTGDGKVNTTSVKAIANSGYRFVGWDDGFSNALRNDEAFENKVYIAIFKRLYTVEFSCDSKEGEISGRAKQAILEGTTTMPVSALPRAGYKFIKWSNGETSPSIVITATENITIHAIFEREFSGFPVISIDTNNGVSIESKEEYVVCTVDIGNTVDAYLLNNVAAKIRGRGNSSWEYPKKSYKLKLDDSADLFGNGKARTWTLISNYGDLSLLRNYLAYSIASLFDTQKFTTTTQFVDLYLNGEYLGVYLLCEQNEVHQNRVDITENGTVDTGYLVELDSREDGEGFYLNDKFYSIKSPDTDSRLFTEQNREFIKSYLEQCIDAINGDDYSKIESLIDTKSFAQAYIVFELFNCVDVGYASFYMYKDAGGKLQCGPVWDFDRSLGVTGNQHGADDFATLWAKENNAWFKGLLSHNEFKSLVSEQLIEYSDRIISTLNSCYEFAYSNESSLLHEFDRWDILGSYVWPNSGPTANLKTWQAHVEFTRQYLNDSLNYLKWIYIENL